MPGILVRVEWRSRAASSLGMIVDLLIRGHVARLTQVTSTTGAW